MYGCRGLGAVAGRVSQCCGPFPPPKERRIEHRNQPERHAHLIAEFQTDRRSPEKQIVDVFIGKFDISVDRLDAREKANVLEESPGHVGVRP